MHKSNDRYLIPIRDLLLGKVKEREFSRDNHELPRILEIFSIIEPQPFLKRKYIQKEWLKGMA